MGSVLGSIGSAGTRVSLFVDFTATTTESDFSMPFIIGYGFAPFLSDPAHDSGMAWRPPRSRCSAYVRAWVLGHRGIPAPLAIAVGRMLPSALDEDLGIPDYVPFGAL